MKRKNKFNIAVLLKTAVVLLVLSAMLLSAMLGVTKAEYFKTLSKKLDLELMPDLALEYYLYDANPKGSTVGNNESTTYHVKTGVYKNSKSILQPIAVGHKDPKTNETYWGKYNNQPIKYLFGDSIIYQIKIPVDESGYYTLDFTVDFLFGGSQNPYEAGLNTHGIEKTTGHYKQSYDHPENDYFEDGVFTQTYQYCMGCEVLNSDDNFVFGSDFNMANRISQTNTQKNNEDERVYYADKGTHSVYQWKTLTPTRAETVKLSFKATDADVTKGYVIWAWDMTGIKGGHNYRISITGLDVNKVMNLDGTTKYRSNVDPYFMFPQTSFTNNQVYVDENQIEDAANNKKYRGSNVPGKTRYSDGRGTFITEATENSLGLRAESLYRSVTMNADGTNAVFTNRAAANQSNPVALQIPVKNIKYDTTYKVTFDFSIARQGNTEVANITTNNTNYTELFAGVNNNTDSKTLGKNLYDYAAFEEIFPSLASDTQFRSYLYATSDPDGYTNGFGITNENHEKRRHQIVYANKIWNNATLDTAQGQSGDFSLTCYNPVTRYNMAQNTNLLKFPNYTTIDEKGTVNDPFCTVVQDWTSDDGKLDMTATTCRNWFNAVQHIEQNGQQGINWITFYNTTFSFNIGKEANIAKLGAANSDGFINNLYWIWQIDALEHMGWYNIRIDNVRIQEVVQYSSEIEKNGVKIADTSIGVGHMKYFADGKNVETDNVFSNYRGWNGTGQNVNPRGYDKGNYFAVGNIYAPVIDARKFSVAPRQGAGATDYKIELDGWAVCEGGIRKYVYSADGGKTWHDMTFTGTNVMASRTFKDVNNNNVTVSGWTYAEYGVEQKLNQQSIYNNATSDFVTFDASDGANCNFDGFKLCADLTPYKNQPDLDIIIAAVPCSNINARCEILRIMNYHSSNYYASQIESISSDIVSSAGNIAIPQEKLAITSATNGNGQAGKWFTDGGKFYYNENNWHVDYYPTSSRGVMTHLNATSAPIRYDNIATMASDIPIKTTLTVKGFVVCYFGVYDYAYSIDGGKSWIDISVGGAFYNKGTTDTTVIYKKNANGSYVLEDGEKVIDQSAELLAIKNKTASKYERLQFQWLTRSFANDGSYFATNNYGKFDTDQTALKIDLSAYTGQVVDVIVAAKPYRYGSTSEKNDIYLPITKVDNVAVYGNDGIFFSRVHSVLIDGRTNENLSGDTSVTPVPENNDHVAGGKLNFADKWNIGYTSAMSYTIFEPQNVNALNARYINDDLNIIKSGGRVTIDGYVICKGGVQRYKYSLDGGRTWTVINDTGTVIPEDKAAANGNLEIEMFKKCLVTDSSFDRTVDGANGAFCCTGLDGSYIKYTYTSSATADDRKTFYDNALEFNIPALPDGAIRDLLVVAESTKGKLVPVLRMKIQCKYSAGNATQYGYQTFSNKANNATLQAGYFSGEHNHNLTPYTSATVGVNNALNRITIPVTEAGKHQLRFMHTLDNGPSTVTEYGKLLYNDDETPNKQTGNTNQRSADFMLTANKKHYIEGEKITVNFSCKFNEGFSGGFGAVRVAIISNDWKNNNGNQHTIYWHQFTPDAAGEVYTIESMKFDTVGDNDCASSNSISALYGRNLGLPSSVIDLKAGSYSIILVYRAPANGIIRDVLKNQDLREKYVVAEVPIYIHEADEAVEFSVVHDDGEYTYFSDTTRQVTSGGDNGNVNYEHIYTLRDPFSNTDTRAINATVNVTEADVERGYIVLDANYTGLWSANEHTDAQCKADYGSNFANNGANAHRHADGVCVSRNADNDTWFYKKTLGDTMYDFTDPIYHEGITYNIKLSLEDNALTKQQDIPLFDTIFAKAEQGYGNNVLMNTVSEPGEHTFSYNPVLNPPIKKVAFNFDNSDRYNGSYLSVPKTYFMEGEPITVDYKLQGASFTSTSSVYMYITSDQICSNGKYGDLYIKRVNLTSNSVGTVKFTADTHNLKDSTYTADLVNAWTNNIAGINELRKLPAGEYKIWLINNNGSFHPFEMLYNPHAEDAVKHLVTEPISIKVIDPENPNLAMIHRDNIPYKDTTKAVPTELILDKVVYEQGEQIRFKINGSWVRNNLCVLKDNVFFTYNIEDSLKTNEQTRYAQHGTYDELIQKGKSINFLNTSNLEPGQYKVVYMYGENLESAWRQTNFGGTHDGSKQRVISIIDITIVPRGTLQNHKLTYTNANGELVSLNLGYKTIAESIQASSYSIGELTSAQIDTLYSNAGYGSNINVPENYGTKESLKYRFDNYTVAPAQITYDVDLNDIKVEDGVNNVAISIDTVFSSNHSTDSVGNSNTYSFKYSALANIAQSGRVHNSTFAGSSLSVPKTYFEFGEPIPVSYVAKGVHATEAWICIADLNEKYIRWEYVKNNTAGTIDIRNAPRDARAGVTEAERQLPPGEYKIWFISNSEDKCWWDYSNPGNDYNNPYIKKRAVTDPISIKIVDSNATNYLLEYEALIGKATEGGDEGGIDAIVKIENNVIKQGEPIRISSKGRTKYMYAWLLDANNNELTSTWTKVVDNTGSGKLDDWSAFYDVAGTSHLAPGKYKLYYAVYEKTDMSSIYNSGAIVTIMDIIVLPGEESVVSPLKLDVTYTNTAGKRVTKTYDVSLDEIEKTAELTDVKSNTTVEFMFYYESAYRQELTNVKATVQRVQQ